MIVEKALVWDTVFREYKDSPHSPCTPPRYASHGKVTKIKSISQQVQHHPSGNQSGPEQWAWWQLVLLWVKTEANLELQKSCHFPNGIQSPQVTPGYSDLSNLISRVSI
jgi:hypothetical protein